MSTTSTLTSAKTVRVTTAVLLSYTVAFLAALAGGYWLHVRGFHPFWVVGIGSFVGATVIFFFSYRYRNSSIFDPFWSVMPPPIALYFAYLGLETGADPLRTGLVLSLVFFWAIRLTWNCMRLWTTMDHEDWRYLDFKKRIKKGYWPFSYLTFHLFPTVMVYLGCLALYPALAIEGQTIGALDLLAAAVTLMGVLFELFADNQRVAFSRNPANKGKSITSGLWAYSRHPNYFGEISFWVGLYLFALAAAPVHWWVGVGCLAMFLMFQFGTLPMMEKRNLQRRPDYKEVIARVPRLIPWFPKK